MQAPAPEPPSTQTSLLDPALGLCTARGAAEERRGKGPVPLRQFFKLSGCLLFPAGARAAHGSLPPPPADVNPS